jgi:hypothetical protein
VIQKSVTFWTSVLLTDQALGNSEAVNVRVYTNQEKLHPDKYPRILKLKSLRQGIIIDLPDQNTLFNLAKLIDLK